MKRITCDQLLTAWETYQDHKKASVTYIGIECCRDWVADSRDVFVSALDAYLHQIVRDVMEEKSK